METDPKKLKKDKKIYQKKVSKIIKNCDKNKYTKIPSEELVDILLLAVSINDKEQIYHLYFNYKKFIPDALLPRFEEALSIKKEEPKEKVRQIITPIIKKEEKKPIENNNISFFSKPYEELPDKTKELLDYYYKEGFVFKTAKEHKAFDNFNDAMIVEEIDSSQDKEVMVHWLSETTLRIKIDGNEDKLTVLEAVEKYKDNYLFMVHLNCLLGLSLYTPYDAYIKEKPMVRVLK